MTSPQRRKGSGKPDFGCADCRMDTSNEYYMLEDAVWALAGLERGLLCIGCCERRIGRRLVFADFMDAPVNRPEGQSVWGLPPKSERLLDRLAS